MTGKSLNHLSSEATQVVNATGIQDAILEISPDDGTLITLMNMVDTGSGEGLPIFADLRDSADTQLADSTDIVLTAERPTDDQPTPVSVKEDNIAAYNQLTTSEQRNEENIDSVKHELRGDRINIRDRDVLYVEIEAASEIDWSNSELYFYRQGVEQSSFSG
jgi:hypothetical protein